MGGQRNAERTRAILYLYIPELKREVRVPLLRARNLFRMIHAVDEQTIV